jgi:hypothetical protein
MCVFRAGLLYWFDLTNGGIKLCLFWVKYLDCYFLNEKSLRKVIWSDRVLHGKLK